MTQAERLIRNLCEERRLQLVEGERQALKDEPEKTPWKDLTSYVQRAVTELRFLDKRRLEMKHRIIKAGYNEWNAGPGKALSKIGHSKTLEGIRKRYADRRTAIQKLRTDATIEALGKSATEAQGILLRLQKDLRKV